MLTHKITVTVPSTTNATTPAPDVATRATDMVLEHLAGLFGGATAVAGIGAWLSQTHGLVKENVTNVYAFTTAEKFEAHRGDVVALARQVAGLMSQECVAVEFNGTMEFVLPTVLLAEAA